MKIILTGITGNLGSEIASQLIRKNHEVVPVIRSTDVSEARSRLQKTLGEVAEKIEEIILCDLEKEGIEAVLVSAPDCVVNAAGVVRFNESDQKNTHITKNALQLAEKFHVPFHHVSTAFVWKPDDKMLPRNDYEKDKCAAEEVVKGATVPWCIVRPSILTGNSKTGAITNFSGYYMIIRAFIFAVSNSEEIVRFPYLKGYANIIPIDLAAKQMIDLIENRISGTHFAVNAALVSSQFMVDEGLEFFAINRRVSFLDCSIEEYEKMDLTKAERGLLKFLRNFQPYWEGKHDFPNIESSPKFEISDQYLRRILSYARGRW